MNDTMSLLFATSILAIGGLGLYMFKTDESGERDNKNNNTLFGWGIDDDNDEHAERIKVKYADENADEDRDENTDLNEDIGNADEHDHDHDYDYEEYKPRKRSSTPRGKTQRNRRFSSSSRRRY